MNFSLNRRGLLLHKNRLYIPNITKIKLIVMNELHKRPYSGHPGYQKVITMIIKDFFWNNMRKEIAEYLAHCIECQQVKTEHQNPSGLLQLLPVPEWKWEIINTDFIIGLLKIFKHHDSIMVVVDNLSKVVHFIPIKSTYKVVNIADIFMKEISRLHGVPKVII